MQNILELLRRHETVKLNLMRGNQRLFVFVDERSLHGYYKLTAEEFLDAEEDWAKLEEQDLPLLVASTSAYDWSIGRTLRELLVARAAECYLNEVK